MDIDLHEHSEHLLDECFRTNKIWSIRTEQELLERFDSSFNSFMKGYKKRERTYAKTKTRKVVECVSLTFYERFLQGGLRAEFAKTFESLFEEGELSEWARKKKVLLVPIILHAEYETTRVIMICCYVCSAVDTSLVKE